MTTRPHATTRATFAGLFIAGASLALFGGTAAAEDTKLSQQPFQISLGSFTNESDVTVRADGETNDGTELDWGNTFGDVDGTKFRLDGYWRINDRHHIRFMYTENSSRKTRVIDQNIEWNDQLFPVNATVDSEFGFKVTELVYEYDFSKQENRELVLSAGIHYTEIFATLKVAGSGGTAAAAGERSLKAPLPVIGARGMWNLGGNWWFDGQAQLFKITFGDVDGTILNYRAAFIWQPKQWFGVGAGYDSFGIDVDASGDRLKGTLDWTYAGPQFFFNFAF